MRLVTSKNRAIQKYLETLSEYSILVQFEARSTKRTAILSNKVKRSYLLRHTACSVSWESDMHEDQGSAFRDSKTSCCSLSQFAMWFTRSTCTRSKIILGIATRCGELRRNPKQHCWLQNTWYVDLNGEPAGCTATKITSQNLSRCSRNISIRNNFLKDMSQKQEINKFSEDSQQILVDMNHTEIFELCENCAKHQCLDCNAFSEIGIIYCSCGRNLKYSRSPTTFQKTNCDFTSILGFVIKNNSSRGPKHGVSERQVMFHKAKQMLEKARQSKDGNHPTILWRWYEQVGHRKPLADHNIGGKEVMLYDRIALERHDENHYRQKNYLAN